MGAQAVRLSNGDIDNALKDRDFEVLFQPIFDLGNGALARVETFIRWRHPSLGVLPPGAFISFFETQGRMSELTRYVLAEALTAYKAWRGPNAPGFSINLALSDLSDESFASHFTVLLREHGFPAELVTLECPMPSVDADLATVSRQLQRLADTGARLAIEVRGRANDFLKTVDPFPFAEIKTGGAAILRFARTVRGPGLSAISELLEMAADQNAAITAVGVEDQASLSALRGLGFAAAQGNHLAKVGSLNQFMPSHVNDVRALLGLEPLSSEDLVALFRTGAPTLATAPAVLDDEDEDAFETDEDDFVETQAFDDDETIADADDAPEIDEGLVDRLAARIARVEARKSDEADGEDQRRARAKAVAIARAKRNGRLREKLAAKNALREKAEARAETPAPRDMQERLSREFGALAEDAPTDDGDAQYPDFIDEAPAPVEEMTGAAAAYDAPEPELDADPIPAPEEPAPRKLKSFDARMAVKGASAHFTPMIRVAGPESAPPPSPPPSQHRDPHSRRAATREASLDEPVEDEIPEPMSTAAWLEETVAIVEEPQAAVPARAKQWWRGKYRLPHYSGYFWPRPVRRWIKSRRAPHAEAAE